MLKHLLFNWLVDYLKPDKLASLTLWLAGSALKHIETLDYTVELPQDLVDSFVKKVKDGKITDEETGQFLIEISKRV